MSGQAIGATGLGVLGLGVGVLWGLPPTWLLGETLNQRLGILMLIAGGVLIATGVVLAIMNHLRKRAAAKRKVPAEVAQLQAQLLREEADLGQAQYFLGIAKEYKDTHRITPLAAQVAWHGAQTQKIRERLSELGFPPDT